MSLLNLKTKTEPKYIKKIINTFEDKLTPEDPIETIKDNIIPSALMIGEGVSITGTIRADNEITIQGSVDGDIDCKDLKISKTGSHKGKIKTDRMSVEGTVEGEVNVKELLKLLSSGSVSGKINYGSIQINEGGKLIGEVDFKDKNIMQEEFKELKSL